MSKIFNNIIGQEVKIFGDILEDEALAQIQRLADFKPYQNSHIRIMPDVHAGKGCTIGTTLVLDEAVTPNLVGVDIGCGMFVVPLGNVEIDLPLLDQIVNEKVPSGCHIHPSPIARLFPVLENLKCIQAIDIHKANCALGSLGGGNHFIELNEDAEGNKFLVIHSGSRNLGVRVCQFYQKIAEDLCRQGYADRDEIIQRLKAEGRSQEIQSELQKLKSKNEPVPDGLAYITGEVKDSYLHDMYIVQDYAMLNRETIAYLILQELGLASCIAVNGFHTVHNYIDTNNNGTILRKGAVRANLGEKLIIPMNMRDGSLICIGKGNPDWNYSAPHGAGRLMSRKKAKESLSLEEFADNMKGVYSSSVCTSTLDEAPMAYKPMQSIVDAIQETVDIQNIIRPIYNFKAKE